MSGSRIRLAIVGVGKIVRDQHLPSIKVLDDYELVAAASRNATIDGVANFKTIDDMLAAIPDIDVVSLCMPPQYRYDAAKLALSKGVGVLLEKPPGATVSEVEVLHDIANVNNATLFATWHSRCACAVEKTRHYLADKQITSVRVDWCENVRKWHPNQEWIWQAGGLGVFDPGINGLSILTHILPDPVYVKRSHMTFPENKAAPITAELQLATNEGLPVDVVFDWNQEGNEVWSISLVADGHDVVISGGGTVLTVDGDLQTSSDKEEYVAIYEQFAHLIRNDLSDVDLAPLKLTADAFMMAERKIVDAFEW